MLSKEDIKVGMRVNPKDLWGIVGVAYIISDFDDVGIGTVLYAGEPYSEESSRITLKLQESGKEICTIYEPYDNEEVSWDE